MHDTTINTIVLPAYIWTVGLIHVIYLAVFFGVFVKIPEQIQTLNIMVQIFICFMLMYRFNPFQKTQQINKFDLTIIFGSAFILFTNVILVELAQYPVIGIYIKKILPLVDSNHALHTTNKTN
jgi:hypothetical protein